MASQKKKRVTLAEAEAMSQRDKRKIIIMSIGAIVILGAFLFARLDANNQANVEPRDVVEAYDIEGGSWSAAEPMTTPRTFFAAVAWP